MPEEIIESCKIADGAIRNSLLGLPEIKNDIKIIRRKDKLIKEVKLLLNAINKIAEGKIKDPWTNPETLKKAVRIGLLDASHLKGNKYDFEGNSYLC